MKGLSPWDTAHAASSGSSNPFIDDNSFSTQSQRDPRVQAALRSYQAPGTLSAPFGSPVAGPIPPNGSAAFQEVPLYSTPTSASSATGAWPAHAIAASTGAKPSPFEIAGPHPSSSRFNFGKARGGRTSSQQNLMQGTTPSDLNHREAELACREAEVARREGLLNSSSVTISNKNWPSKRFMPLVHHDIGGDIPADRRGVVRAGYLAWWLVALGYVWNFICITAFFIGGQKKVSLWVMSGLVAVAGLPLSFLCWYRQLYHAAKGDSGFRFFFYFLNMMAHIVWCWWMFVGIRPDLGGYSAGLFTMVQQFEEGGGRGIAFGIMSVINMAVFAASGALSILVLGKSWSMFRRGNPVPQTRLM